MRPGAIWYQAAGRAEGAAESPFSSEQQAVLDLLRQECPELYLGLPQARQEDPAIQALSRRLCQDVSAATRKERLDFFNAGIAIGNRTLGWEVPLSVVPVAIHRERNQVRPDDFHPRAHVKPLVEAFTQSLVNELSAPAAYGQVLCSAILFGALLESRWQHPFLEAVVRHRFYQEGSQLWMDLEMEKRPKPSGLEEGDGGPGLIQRKRWVADCLTQLLLYRLLDHGLAPRSKPPEPWAALNAFFDTLPLPQELRPASLAQLRTWAYARALLLLPPQLLAYASGNLPAASLPIGA